MQEFGLRLRRRIKAAGFGNISALLRSIRISHSLVHDLHKGKIGDTGVGKVAEIAIMLGKRPSELMAEMDELLLNPPALTAEEIETLSIPGSPSDYDPFKLALIADVVEGWDEETMSAKRPEELGPLIADLYDLFVRPDTSIGTLELRRRVMARLFEVDLPMPEPVQRRRGRPSSADAA